MNKESLNLVKKLSTIILFFSITSLILTSLLPWVTVETDEDSANVKYLNLEMMKTSDNNEVDELSDTISILNILLWLVIIIAFMSLFGIVLCITKKFLIFAKLLIFAGFFILIIYIVILIYNIILLDNINDIKGVSLATFLGTMGYAHIIILFNILPFIISIYYSINIISLGVECFSEKKKGYKKTKKHLKRSDKDISKKEELFIRKDSKTLSHEKHTKPEDWNQGETEEISIKPEENEDDVKDSSDIKLKQVEDTYFDDKNVDLDKKHGRQNKKETMEKEIEVEPVYEEEGETEKKKDDKIEKEPEDLKQNFTDKSFENALISAIEKRKKAKSGKQNLTKSGAKAEIKKNDKFERGTYKVKCARCKNIFTTELKNKGDKIKCPECGKEGTVS